MGARLTPVIPAGTGAISSTQYVAAAAPISRRVRNKSGSWLLSVGRVLRVVATLDSYQFGSPVLSS